MSFVPLTLHRLSQIEVRCIAPIAACIAVGGILLPTSAAYATPGNEVKKAVVKNAVQGISAEVPPIAEPDKGGPAGVCSMMSLNARLHSRMCDPRLRDDSVVLSRCTKEAIAAGFRAAGTAAVATTPLHWDGMVLVGSFTYLGTYVACEADRV